MKTKLIFPLFVFILLLSCSNNNIDIIEQEKYPLTAFAVKVDGKLYNAKIDQNTCIAEIGGIDNANSITDVVYTLLDSASTISPDPKSFLGAWVKEQNVTVTTSDKQNFEYKIILTDFSEENADVIFWDDFDVDGIPNESYWSLCPKQTSDWNDEMSESYDQAYVEDGKLILKAEKINDEYKAGGVQTSGKFDFTFGKLEVRARITSYPNGAFPAIWLMPSRYIYQGWPACGEIDVMEHIKQESWIHHTLHTHYIDNLGYKNDPLYTKHPECNFSDWIVYGMEWTADKITFFIDGVETFSYPNLKLPDEEEKKQWPFTEDSAFYIILNMGLGGDREGSWPGPIDDSNLPAKMEIDWVKVSKPRT